MGVLKTLKQAEAGALQSINKHTRAGLTREQLRGGLQVAVGLWVLMATVSTPKVWKALSLPDAALSPTYGIVTFCVCLQPILGSAAQFVVMRALGATAGGLLGLTCLYLTFWANGSTYESDSVTKAAVMVTLLSVFAFCIGLLRFRFTQYWFAFVVTTFSMAMVALNTFHLDYPQYKAMFYWWLQIALGVGTAALVSTFVAPVTAGQKVRTKTQDSFIKLGQLTEAVLAEMLKLSLGADGLPQGVKGSVEGPHAIDTGLKDDMSPLYRMQGAISGNIETVKSLLQFAASEFDVYEKSHTFPVEAYRLLVMNVRAYLSSLMMLLYPLQSGKLSLKAVQSYQGEVQLAGTLLLKSLQQLAGCLDNSVMYKDALQSLRELESHWHALGALCPSPQDDWSENDILAGDMLLATLFNLGTRVRRMFLAMPDAVHDTQPGCRAYAGAHFKKSAVWDMTRPKRALKSRALERASNPVTARVEASFTTPRKLQTPKAVQLNGLQQSRFLHSRSSARLGVAVKGAQDAAAHAGPAGASSFHLLDASNVGESFPPLIPLPPIKHTWFGAALEAIHRSTGFASSHISMALQLAFGIAASSVLLVDENTYNTLHQKSIWIVVTVAFTFDRSLTPSLGGTIWRATMRCCGTALAGIVGLGLVYLTTLINGLSYHNAPAKFITMAICLPLVCGMLNILHLRLPHHYAYLFSCAGFTTPIVALSGYVGEIVPWDSAVWRLCAVVIGVGINLASSSLIFPVTGRRAVKHKVEDALHGLAELAEQVVSQFVSGASLRPASPLASPLGSYSDGKVFGSPGRSTPGGGTDPPPTSRTPHIGRTGSLALDLELGLQPHPSPLRIPAYPPQPSPRQPGQLFRASSSRQQQMLRTSSGVPRRSSELTGRSSWVPRRSSEEPRRSSEVPRRSSEVPRSSADLPRRQSVELSRTEGTLPAGYASAQDLEDQRAQQAQQAQQGGSRRLEPPITAAYPSVLDLVEHDRAEGPEEGGTIAAGYPSALDLVQNGSGQQAPAAAGHPPAGNPAAQQVPLQGGPEGAVVPAAYPSAGDLMQLPSGIYSVPSGVSIGDMDGQEAGQLPAAGLAGSGFLDSATDLALSSRERGRAGAAEEGEGQLQPSGLSTPRRRNTSGALPPGAVSPFATPRRTASGAVAAPAAASMSPIQHPPHPLPALHIPLTRTFSVEGTTPRSPLERTTSNVSKGFISHTPTTRGMRAQRSLWLRRHVLGRVFVDLHDHSVSVAGLINQLGELAKFSKYEWDPFLKPHRLAAQDIRAAQTACRKMLNVLLSVAYVLDAPDIPHLQLLAPFSEEVQIVASQMSGCLQGLNYVIRGHLDLDSALGMVRNLALQVQLLLLEVEQRDLPPGASEADLVLGYACLGVLFSAMQTVPLLYQSVLRMFGSPGDLEKAQQSFEQTAAWGTSMETLLMAQGVVLSHLATSAEADKAREEQEVVPTVAG